MKKKDISYRDFPELAKYIDRIGAEESTFRRFLVKEQRARGYYIERCIIRISRDCEISVTNKDYAPSKDEAAAIKAELIRIEFPKTVAASETQLDELRAELGKDAKLFFFKSRRGKDGGGYTMAQQRVEIDGAKKYLPWTYWADGKWRRMEPDGGLPFWKPIKPRFEGDGGWKIMVHEGAKTAAFVDDLVNNPQRKDELEAHPFGEIFKKYEHWGLIGGALAPHRTDYNELKEAKPTEMIYVCDNDYGGIAALREISQLYGQQMKGIVFDKRWPPAFDFADVMPKELFSTLTGEYIGPTWHSLLKFCTYATELMPNPAGSGRPIPRISYNFREEWWHCVTPAVFIHRDWPANVFNEADFNSHVFPYSHVEDTARLVRKENASKTAVLSYQPHLEPGIYSADGGSYINTHVGAKIMPRPDVSPAPWVDFLEHLVPNDKDRFELMKWVATLIARPDIKMFYGVLLVSEVQGIGKSTLGEKILAPLMGHRNVSYPSETEIVDSAFNGWAAHKRLAVVHEIYAGHSAKAYNKLKSIITDRFITVNKKYQASYEIENWMHILACSNSPRAIQVSMDDRRWFVPRVTDLKQTNEYWQKFNDWLTDGNGLGSILAWAMAFVEHDFVRKGADAPWSGAKSELVEEAYSPGMELVKGALEALGEVLSSESEAAKTKRAKLAAQGVLKDGAVLIVDKDFVEFIRLKLHGGRHSDHLERPHTVRRVAKGSHGWFVGKESLPYRGWGQARFKGRLISNSATVAARPLADLPEGLKPLSVETLTEL
jgi:hypothetical protein